MPAKRSLSELLENEATQEPQPSRIATSTPVQPNPRPPIRTVQSRRANHHKTPPPIQNPQEAIPQEELPGHSTMAQILTMIEQDHQTQTLLLQQMANLGAAIARSGSGDAPHHSKLGMFLETQPTTFSTSTDPLDADDWLRAIESKLAIVQCNDQEKVLYASFQLQGAAAAWWENHQALVPHDQAITWDAFKEAFRRTHIPAGPMNIKRREFLNLRQGSMTVMEYLHRFNDLSRYATSEITTEARKIEHFRDNLNEEIKWMLAAHDIHEFQALVDKAIRVECSTQEVMESRKRKWIAQKSANAGSKPRVGQPSNAHSFAPPQQGCQVPIPQPRQPPVRPTNNVNRQSHIPASLMDIKRREFLNLRQGSMTVMEYLHRFNDLSLYATSEITTEARKIEHFRDNLNEEIKWMLAAHDIHEFHALVDKAIRVECSTQEVMESRKRKRIAQKFANAGYGNNDDFM